MTEGPNFREANLDTRILIVDDSPLVRLRLRDLLQKHVNWTVCGEAANGLDALKKVQELHPDLIVKPQDETVLKQRFSAFIQGSSGLPEKLRAEGFDTVLITGTVTNVCCESSARDAMMLNFKTIMVSDANAAMTDAEHNATLVSIYSSFGDVMDTDMIIAALERARAPRAA